MRDFRILVIDDDFLLREVIEDVLSINGFGVDSYSNTTDASAYLRTYIPSLIICDRYLPDRSGLQWLALESIILKNHHIPIILLTADQDRLDDFLMWEPLSSLSIQTIKKPFKNQELLTSVRSLI